MARASRSERSRGGPRGQRGRRAGSARLLNHPRQTRIQSEPPPTGWHCDDCGAYGPTNIPEKGICPRCSGTNLKEGMDG